MSSVVQPWRAQRALKHCRFPGALTSFSRSLCTKRIRHFICLAPLVGLLLMTGCTPPEETVGVDITAYNHTFDQSLYIYTVNGNMGSGPGPQSGGGKFSCCVAIPRTWRPGIKLKIWWNYSGGSGIPPEPPPHVAEVELPEYKNSDRGAVNVHFYPGQKIKVIAINKGLGHPAYPADLDWDAPTPADAVAGRPLPYPPEENEEITGVLLGENYAQSLDRIAAGKARADAVRAAKQARWDAAQAAKTVAATPAEPASAPTSLTLPKGRP